MIKITNTEVFGWGTAVRGMRNPMNSWDRSDSFWCNGECDECPERGNSCNGEHYIDFVIGDNDYALMEKLVKAGSDHAKFMRMINVTMDVTAPVYWWSEYDTYKVGTVANSCSKMHKLLCKPFEMSDFSFDKLSGFKNEIKQFRPEVDEEEELWKRIDADYDVSNQGRIRRGSRVLSGSVHRDNYIFVTLHGMLSKRQIAKEYGVSHTCVNDIINDKYKYAESVNVFEEVARPLVDTLNELRDSYFSCEDETSKKQIWYSIVQLLPSSYNQMRTVQLNYAVLRNMYHARKNHKLDEWRDFCSWVESLPYAELITLGGNDNGKD